MKRWMNATIKWIQTKDGGRRLPMAIGIRYCPIIEFPSTIAQKKFWSADIYVLSQTNRYESTAKLSYFSEKAPFELLQEGVDFELYEGDRLVATGTICSEYETS